MSRRQEPRIREESEAHRWQAPYGRRIPDLTDGLCYDQPGFLDQPKVDQYRDCIRCPVSSLCPFATPWPKGECCRQGHEKNVNRNHSCKACSKERGKVAHALKLARNG